MTSLPHDQPPGAPSLCGRCRSPLDADDRCPTCRSSFTDSPDPGDPACTRCGSALITRKPDGLCGSCRYRRRFLDPPKEHPGIREVLREELGIAPDVDLRVDVIDGSQVGKEWQGYRAEVLSVPLEALTFCEGFPEDWIWDPGTERRLADGTQRTVIPALRAVIRWRVWHLDNEATLTLTWGPGGLRRSAEGPNHARKKDLERLEKLIGLIGPGAGRPVGSGKMTEEQFHEALWKAVSRRPGVEGLSPYDPHGYKMTRPVVAKRLGMHPDTLDEYLHDHGPAYKDLKAGRWRWEPR